MSIYDVNEAILKEWQESNELLGEQNFAKDGIVFRGEMCLSGVERKSDKDIENSLWEKAPLRILFLTKDQNCGDEGAWDVRSETGRNRLGSNNISNSFFRNLLFILYTLAYTSPSSLSEYEYFYNKEDALKLYDSFPLARINVKKESGNNNIKDNILKKYLERDRDFITKQVINLDSDIIVCCGYSQKIGGTCNLLLNFLNENGYNFQQQDPLGWIYYDAKKNKVAVNSFHPSYPRWSKTMYKELECAYQTFLRSHPDFLKSHR